MESSASPQPGKRRSHAVLVLRGLCREGCFSLFYFFHAICVAKHLLFVWLKCQTPPWESEPAQPILQMTTRANWCEWAFLRRCRSPASTEPEFPGCASILLNSAQKDLPTNIKVVGGSYRSSGGWAVGVVSMTFLFVGSEPAVSLSWSIAATVSAQKLCPCQTNIVWMWLRSLITVRASNPPLSQGVSSYLPTTVFS